MLLPMFAAIFTKGRGSFVSVPALFCAAASAGTRRAAARKGAITWNFMPTLYLKLLPSRYCVGPVQGCSVGTLSFVRLKLIARATHSLEVPGIFWVLLNLFAQASYIYVHRARRYKGEVAPNGVEHLIAGIDAARMRGKKMQQAEFSGCYVRGLSAHS